MSLVRKFGKEIGLRIGLFRRCRWFHPSEQRKLSVSFLGSRCFDRGVSLLAIEHSFHECTEFHLFENFSKSFFVGSLALQFMQVQFDGHIGLDGGKELGESDEFLVGFHFCLQGTFQLVGVGQQVLDASELGDELLCGFLSHTRTSRNVVRGVAHQAEHINHLQGGFNVELGFDLLNAHHLEFLVSIFRTIHKDILTHQLTVVFVWSHHVCGDASFACFSSQSSDDIVGFVAWHFQNRDAISANDILYNRYGKTDDFGCFFALGLVLFVGFVTEGWARRVKGYTDVCRILLFKHIFQCIDESQDGRSIESLRVDSGIFDECIVSTIDQCVGIKQEKFVHD